jgi:chitodextrinase
MQTIIEQSAILMAAGLLMLIQIIALAPSPIYASGENRTVIDNERLSWYSTQYDNNLGMYLNTVSYTYATLNAETLKAPHGYFQHHNVNPSLYGDSFPVQLLRDYEAYEKSNGRDPIWVTATYNGIKYPVYYSLFRDDPNWRYQAVNLGDDRYVKFFIHEYVYNTAWPANVPNMFISSDTCIFDYPLHYGIIDNAGVWRNGIAWDSPFPSTDNAYLDSIKTFNRRLDELAPDVRLNCNIGQMSQEGRFMEVFGTFDFLGQEEISQDVINPDQYSAWRFHRTMNRMEQLAATKAKLNLTAFLPETIDPTYAKKRDDSALVYLLAKTDNSFFGPIDAFQSRPTETKLSSYIELWSELGEPTGPVIMTGTGDNLLYSRPTQGGIVYVNMTGTSKTVALPTDRAYYNRDRVQATFITIPSTAVEYVSVSPQTRAPRPQINPRMEWAKTTYTGPFTIKMQTPTEPTTITYTLDGSEPTSASALYTAPFSLFGSTTVKAKAFASGKLESFTSTAKYTVTPTDPTVKFHLASDSASQLLGSYYPLVALSNPSSSTVTVQYQVTGGTAVGGGTDYTLENGILTFAPGEQYKRFKITLTNLAARDYAKMLIVTLSSPTNGTLGTTAAFTLNINSIAPPLETIVPLTPETPSATAVSPTQINLSWIASADNLAVTGYKIYRDGNQIGTSGTNSYQDTSVSGATTYTYAISAYDASGNTSPLSLSASATTPNAPDTALPVVAVSDPVAGSTVSGSTVSICATASDDVGVVGVQFKVDGVNLGNEDTSSPYSIIWNTTSATNGNYIITATARDAAGNIGVAAPVVATVNNQIVINNPPLISSVSAINTSSNSATITWTTDIPSTSQVEYGKTTSVGSASALHPTLTTSHQVILTGLSKSTTYYYRVKSASVNSAETVGSTLSFQTSGRAGKVRN